MNKLILAALTLLLLSFPVIFQAYAAETILFFAPTRIDLTEENPVQEIRVTNMSQTVRSYSLSPENIVMNESGVTEQVQDFAYSAKRMVRFVPHKFDIKPGEKQIIRIMGRFLPDMHDGDYHMHINFLENLSRSEELNKDAKSDNKASAVAQIAYSTSIPVIISKGAISSELSLKDALVGTDKEGRANVKLKLSRSGNGQGNALIEAYYTPPGGTQMMAGVRRSVSVYREIGQRDYDMTLELIEPSKLQKGGTVTLKLFNKAVSQEEPSQVLDIPV
jgi:P pilus assembly chaperone PapD